MREDYYDWKRFIEAGRNKVDRPIANNTRVHLTSTHGRDFDTNGVAIKLHSTDIITFWEDGFITLSSGGWQTITTLSRLRDFWPSHRTRLVSEQGTWYIEPTRPYEPEPPRGECEVPVPFTVPDPGPEPVDDGENCVAGTREEFIAHGSSSTYYLDSDPYEYVGYSEPEPWIYVSNRLYADGSGPARRAHRAFLTGIIYGETEHNSSWGLDHDKKVDVPAGWTYKQCPHCAEFRTRHTAWHLAMYGERWGHNRERGYSQMCEWLDEFGSAKEWRKARTEAFRLAREQRKAWKEWRDRNRVEFHDGVQLAPDGLPVHAPRPRVEQARIVLLTTTGINRKAWEVATA